MSDKDKRIEELMAIVNPLTAKCKVLDYPDMTAEFDEILGYCKENFDTPSFHTREADIEFCKELMKATGSNAAEKPKSLINLIRDNEEYLIVVILMIHIMPCCAIQYQKMKHFGWFYDHYAPLILRR